MKKEIINEKDLNKVVGGSIVFTTDHKTCGYNCNDQYRVLDYDSCMAYMMDHYFDMSERDLLKKCVEKGYIEEI